MRRSWIAGLFVIALFASARIAVAQDAAELVEQGIAAFREERYEAAAAAFERATRVDPNYAEAYFLLARVYAETPLRDNRKADRALDRALELEPDNIRYLVGRLQQLRRDASNFFTERIREAKRMELARRILRIDSTNAFAHEDLGRVYIHDFWRYRNAIMIPNMRFSNDPGGNGVGRQFSQARVREDNTTNPIDLRGQNLDAAFLDQLDGAGIETVFQADRFDLELLAQRGVPVLDLSRRAQEAYERAIGHLKQALASDPRRRGVYTDLMEIYMLKGAYAEAVEMLSDMVTFFPDDPATWLYLGLAQYRLRNMDAAHEAFENAFRFMDEEERAAFSSLDYFLTEDEKRTYEADPVAYASRFWTSKDPRYLTYYNERKLEHYARLVYADLLYASEDLKLRGWDTERGRILVRYGVPKSDVVLVPGETGSSLESVLRDVMKRPGGELALERADTEGDLQMAAQRLMALYGSPADMLEEANTYNIWDYGDFRFVFEDPYRNQEYRLYSPSAEQVNNGVNPWLNDYVIRARETFRKIPERYVYEAPGRQIQLPYLVTAFKGEEGKADLYVHYGVPITQMPEAGQETINVTANVGAFLISSARDILVEERRTIYGLQTSKIVPFAETRLWVDSHQMSAPPGKHEVSMEFETASGGTVAVQRREVEVPDFSAGNLALSDLMLAYRVEEVAGDQQVRGSELVRHGLAITPAPWSVFSAGQPIYLYFETYNLGRNAEGRTDYEVEALLAPKDRSKGIAKLFKGIFGGDKGVAVRLPASGTSADDGQYLILDATNQEPGLYTLVLRVHDNVSGKEVHREMDLMLE